MSATRILAASRLLLFRALSTPAPGPSPSPGENRTITWVAFALGAWMLLYKLQSYYGLDYTSDLFVVAQLSTSWLKGPFLSDHYYGDHRSIHTYFLAPVLAVFVKPLGAPGLLVALSLAYAAGFGAAAKILRFVGLPLGWALTGGLLVSLMPFTVHQYQDLVYGFHLELLMPALGLWLAYFLLRRSWVGTLATAVALLAVKEEAPVLTAAIGCSILTEDFLRGTLGGGGKPGSLRRPINLPALVVVTLAVAALPLLLIYLSRHSPGTVSPWSFGRIKAADGVVIDGPYILFAYVHDYLATWLGSTEMQRWFQLALVASFGLAVLRPHFLCFGAATSIVSWLARDDLIWAPRLSPALAFYQVVAVLALASLYHLFMGARVGTRAPSLALGIVLLGLAGVGFRLQAIQAPRSGEFFLQRPRHAISAEERAAASQVFSEYRSRRQPDDAVLVYGNLFRYADSDNVYWPKLGVIQPTVWVMMDYSRPVEKPAYGNFLLVSHSGRFALFRVPNN